MRRIVAFLFLALFFPGAAFPAEPEYRIRMPEKASVIGPRVHLGDIADVLGGRPEKVRKVRRVFLSQAAPAGGTLRIGKGLVRIALRKEGYDPREFELEGAETSLVRTQSQVWDPRDILPQARNLILGKLKESPENVEIRLAGEGEPVSLPAGKVVAELRPPLSGRYEGLLLLTADLSVDGRPVRTLPLRLNVEVFRPVVVSLGRIEKGAKFTEGNVGLVRKPASAILPGTVGDLRNILGRTAAVYVAPGTILRMHSIFDPPVVRRGSVVQALARRGSVELSVDAKALEDAKAGETVLLEGSGP